MTSPLPLPRPRFIVSSGSGDPAVIDAYLYGDNARILTFTDNPYVDSGPRPNHHFVTLILVTTTGGFGAEPQADRLASGLYGGKVFDTFEAAWDYLAELRDLVLR